MGSFNQPKEKFCCSASHFLCIVGNIDWTGELGSVSYSYLFIFFRFGFFFTLYPHQSDSGV